MKDHLVVLLLLVKLLTGVNGGLFFTLRLHVESYPPTERNLCYGGDVGLTDTSIQVQYRLTNVNTAATDWRTLKTIDPEVGFDGNITLCPILRGVQFRLLQLEHGGGSCNCWWVIEIARHHPLIGPAQIGTCFTQNSSQIFCGGIARKTRGFVSMTQQLTSVGVGRCPNNSNSQLITGKGVTFSENCSTEAPKLEVSYTLFINPTQENEGCGGPERVDEGIEFSMRTNTSGVYGPWIPLRLTWRWPDSDMRNDTIINKTRVRGYDVETHGVPLNIVTQQLTVCGGDLLPTNASEVQFRWMNTAGQPGQYDMWAIFNVTVDLSINNGSEVYRILDTETEGSSVWQEVRNGSTNCTACTDVLPCRNKYLTLGGFEDAQTTSEIYTKIALTKPIPLAVCELCDLMDSSGQMLLDSMHSLSSLPSRSEGHFTTNIEGALPDPTSSVFFQPSLPNPTSSFPSQPSPTSVSQPSFTSRSSTTSASQLKSTSLGSSPQPSPTSNFERSKISDSLPSNTFLASQPYTTQPRPNNAASPTPNDTQSASMIRDQFAATIASEIRNNSVLNDILIAEPSIAVSGLLDLSREDPPSPAITLYLIGDILIRINRNNLTKPLIKIFHVLDSLSVSHFRPLETRPDVVGSSFLSSLDRLFPFARNFTGSNTFIQALSVSADTDEYTAITDSEDFIKDAPRMSISLPPELLGKFTRSGEGRVQVISAVLYGVEELFPNEGPRSSNGSFLGPGIVSTSLVCENATLCDTNQLNLTDPVLINFEHSQEVIGNTRHNFKVECVFWNFLAEGSNESAGLTIGEWSSEGCSPNSLSNDSYTVCECDHLTHFAILLSPVPVDFDEKITLSLEVTGYVGVSISLVAMTITILTFLIFRSLHNIRSYIHIHLCINLMIAQLIFVVGIDKSAEDHVPVHCQVIAVLLHDFFLVSFMWMLMEGVVLYVVLVLVFTKRRKLYMLCFTLASYGLPLVYMGLLTLPLGFSLDNQHYGSTSHCFLNPETHFIWAVIAPVIVIIVVNFVLFLIVVRVMWKHQKKRKDNTNVANIRRWLRSAVFLVVVMGITWIVGVSVTEVEALLPLTYIFTIMVAFQGFAIFLVFVIFSKQVREAYRKWWTVRVNNSTVLSKYFGDFSLTLGTSSKSNAKAMIGSEQKNSSLLNDSMAKEKNCPDDSVVIANPDSS